MSQNKKLILIIVAVIVVGTAAIYLVTKFKVPPLSGYSKISELQTLTKSEDCEAAAKFSRKDSSDAVAWHWKGICEFESGKYEEAKLSFEQVLVLDSEHQAAKNYLDILSEGGFIDLAQSGFLREEFESLMKTNFPASFDFQFGYTIPINEQLDIVSAEYTTNLSTNEAVAELETAIKNAGFAYTTKDDLSQTGVIIYEIASDGELVYSIWINTVSDPVKVAVSITTKQ